MTLPWQKLKHEIDAAHRILLTTHVRPDGDALGSELALADLLAHFGKTVAIFNPSPTPRRYQFLDPAPGRIAGMWRGEPSRPPIDPDLIVILDTGTWSQLADFATFVRQSKARKVVIDHHVTQDDLGALRFVDQKAPACGMLVTAAYDALQTPIGSTAANALFCAIALDTGWMHHSNTSAEVLRVLARLVERGANPTRLYQELYETNSQARMQLLGTLLHGLRLEFGGRVAWGRITRAAIHAVNAHPMDTEDFIQYLMGINGVEVAALFIEQEGGVTKVSLRSRGEVDCSALTAQFGGGGHRPAAGASVSASLEETKDRVLQAIEQVLPIQTPSSLPNA